MCKCRPEVRTPCCGSMACHGTGEDCMWHGKQKSETMNQKSAREKKDNVMVVNVLTTELSVEINPDTRLPELRGFDQMRELFYLELENRDKALEAERQRCEGLREALNKISAERVLNFKPDDDYASSGNYDDAFYDGSSRAYNYCADIADSALSSTSAVESEKCKCCGSDLCQCDERCCKPMTQEPSPKHIIFKGRVYGLLEEGCYTMKNPVQVVEKTQEPSLLEKIARNARKTLNCFYEFAEKNCQAGSACHEHAEILESLLAEYEQTKEGA